MLDRRNFDSVIHQQDEKKFSERLFIGTLGVNCVTFTRRCIDTVNINCSDVRFVYIDNGSEADNIELIKKWHKRNQCITEFDIGINGHNAGVGPGWNQLIKLALDWKATKIIICNNDIAFGDKTISGMIQAFDRLKEFIPETVMVTAANKTKNPAQLKEIKQEWKYAEHPDFSCFMIEPDFVEKIGMISEEYIPAFHEDNDTHWRILLQGYKAFGTDWAPYSHVASRTRYENPNIVTHARFRENKIKFFRRMLTDTVDQKIADQRYAAWIADHPDRKHPTYVEVLEHAKKIGLITPKLLEWLDQRTVLNTP